MGESFAIAWPITSCILIRYRCFSQAVELGRRADLVLAIEDRLVGRVLAGQRLLDHLDPDRPVVEADRVPAAHVEAGQLVDRAVLLDDELRADARALAEGRARSHANVLKTGA